MQANRPAPDADLSTLASDSPACPARPTTVPGYEVLDELGRGGMGVVYRAKHLALSRVVALKTILAPGHAGAQVLDRFRREAETLARLQHPHITQIFEVGQCDGIPYLTMELVEGGSLASRLAAAPLPARPAAELVSCLAGAAHAAHQAGVVHRDLKPANILLTADGAPKVSDFGLAKPVDGQADLTQSGAVLGTPSYMAPEQAGGATKAVGPAADVYALGAILYECLTGRPPFKAATVMDTLMQVVADEPVPPTRLQPKVPRDLETVCLKCLQKEPRKRYATAAALTDDLGRFLEGRPVEARPVSRLGRGWRWCRRNPAVAGSLAAVAAALVAATTVSLYFAALAGAESHRARAAVSERDAAIRRERAAHDKLVRFARIERQLAHLSDEEFLTAFLKVNPDVEAVAPGQGPGDIGGTAAAPLREAGGFAVTMKGD